MVLYQLSHVRAAAILPTGPVAEQLCPGCGMGEHLWTGNGGEGIQKDGQTYCCQGRANQGMTGCTCGRTPHSSKSLLD